MPEPQAEAVVRGQAHLLEHNLASKADIESLQPILKSDLENPRLTFKTDTENLHLTLKADIERLGLQTKADIERSKVDLIKWVAGINLATASLLRAAIKFL